MSEQQMPNIPAQSQPDATPAPTQQNQAPAQSTPDTQIEFSKRFAALARKEKQIRDQEAQWKSERDQVKPKLEEYDRLNNIFSQAKTRDPKAIKAALDVLGLSAGDISELALRDPDLNEDPKIAQMRREYADLKAKIDELSTYKTTKEKEESDRIASMEEQKNMEGFKAKVSEMIKANAEKYDLCSCLGDEVYEMALAIGDKHYQENDGEILPLDKILEMLETEEEKRISKFKTSKKLGFSAQSSNQDASKGTTPSITLTNNQQPASKMELTGLTGEARKQAIIEKYSRKN